MPVPCTHRVLLNAVWGGESVHQPEYLRVSINQLRNKVEPEAWATRAMLAST